MSRSICTTEGCGRFINARGLCWNHYDKAVEAGLLGTQCQVDGCTKGVRSRGMCKPHYHQAFVNGEFALYTCKINNCTKPIHARSLCKEHYDTDRQSGLFAKAKCLFDGCDSFANSLGYCRSHYYELRKSGGLSARKCEVPDCTGYVRAGNKCARHNSRASRYGLSIEELVAFDKGVLCAICGTTAKVIDHCHRSNQIRGYLCHNCNKALGLMHDDPERLRHAAEYLEANGELKIA